jgi:tetratricopeptide (TPR) repeat protein
MDAYTDRLSEYLDGEDLDSSDRAEIEDHLETCPACRAVLAELRDVTARAGTLHDRIPDGDLWPGIAARIDSARTIPFEGRAARRISFTIPQVVAASLALMLLSGAMVWVSRIGGTRVDIEPIAAAPGRDQRVIADVAMADFADAQYDDAVADLEKALAAGRDTLDPQTVRVLEENLGAIDRAIEQSRQALSADPANLFLNTHLAAARQRKLALLRSATALATKG